MEKALSDRLLVVTYSPGGTPANYWDWSCAHGFNTCCTEFSLARGDIGKCSGAMGQAATPPSAWAEFVTHPQKRVTIFDLYVSQSNLRFLPLVVIARIVLTARFCLVQQRRPDKRELPDERPGESRNEA